MRNATIAFVVLLLFGCAAQPDAPSSTIAEVTLHVPGMNAKYKIL